MGKKWSRVILSDDQNDRVTDLFRVLLPNAFYVSAGGRDGRVSFFQWSSDIDRNVWKKVFYDVDDSISMTEGFIRAVIDKLNLFSPRENTNLVSGHGFNLDPNNFSFSVQFNREPFEWLLCDYLNE